MVTRTINFTPLIKELKTQITKNFIKNPGNGGNPPKLKNKDRKVTLGHHLPCQ